MSTCRKLLEVDTNGMCHLCKNLPDADPESEDSIPFSLFSLEKFLRYLEVNTTQVVNGSLQGLDNMGMGKDEDVPVKTNDDVDVIVTLCDGCSGAIERFHPWTTSAGLDKGQGCPVRSIRRFIKNADECRDRNTVYNARMKSIKVDSARWTFNCNFAGFLRNEIFYKCSAKLQRTSRTTVQNRGNGRSLSLSVASTSSAVPRRSVQERTTNVDMASNISEPRLNFGGSVTNGPSTSSHGSINHSLETRENGGEDQSNLRLTVSPLSAVSTNAVLGSIPSCPGSINNSSVTGERIDTTSANLTLGDESPPPQLERMDSPWSYEMSRASSYSADFPSTSTSGASVDSSYASASCLSNRDQCQKACKNRTTQRASSKVNPCTSRVSQPLQINSPVVLSADSAVGASTSTPLSHDSSTNSAIGSELPVKVKVEAWDNPSTRKSRDANFDNSTKFHPNRSLRQQPCPECHEEFSPSQMRKHLAVHHPEVIVRKFFPPASQDQCTYTVCMKAFDRVLPGSRNHCPYCDLVCSTRNQLKFHLLSDHVEKFAEEVCSHAEMHPVPQGGEEESGDAEGVRRRTPKRRRDGTPVARSPTGGEMEAGIDVEVVNIVSREETLCGTASDYQLCHICKKYKRRRDFTYHLNACHPETLVGKCFPPGKESECTYNMCTKMFEMLLPTRKWGSKDRFQCPYCTCTLANKVGWKYHVVSTHAQIFADEMSAAFPGSALLEGESGNGDGNGDGAGDKRALIQCDLCGDCFGSKVKLTQHRSQNGVESCFLCGFTASGCSLTVHQRRAHTVIMVMKEIPGKSKMELTPLVDKIIIEIQTDDNNCGQCGKILESLEELKGHFFATHFRELVKEIGVRCGSRGDEGEVRRDDK